MSDRTQKHGELQPKENRAKLETLQRAMTDNAEKIRTLRNSMESKKIIYRSQPKQIQQDLKEKEETFHTFAQSNSDLGEKLLILSEGKLRAKVQHQRREIDRETKAHQNFENMISTRKLAIRKLDLKHKAKVEKITKQIKDKNKEIQKLKAVIRKKNPLNKPIPKPTSTATKPPHTVADKMATEDKAFTNDTKKQNPALLDTKKPESHLIKPNASLVSPSTKTPRMVQEISIEEAISIKEKQDKRRDKRRHNKQKTHQTKKELIDLKQKFVEQERSLAECRRKLNKELRQQKQQAAADNEKRVAAGQEKNTVKRGDASGFEF